MKPTKSPKANAGVGKRPSDMGNTAWGNCWTIELVVIGLDVEGRITYFEPLFFQTDRFSPKGINGEKLVDQLLPERQKRRVKKAFQEKLQKEVHWHLEAPLITRSGEEKIISWNHTVLRDEQGEVLGTLSIGRDITDQKKLEATLKQLSTLDGLTGIPNRRHFDEFVEREWKRACRERVPFSFLMADIDFFKAYNDTYGHLLGDACLKQVAKTLKDSLRRPGDLVARYGGEEFSIILPRDPFPGGHGPG